MYLAHRSRSLRELASYTRLKAMPDLALGLLIGGGSGTPSGSAFSNALSADFDGSDAKLNCTIPTTLMANDFTTSIWVRFPGSPSNLHAVSAADGAIWVNNYTTASAVGWRLYFKNTNTAGDGNISVWIHNASGQYDNPIANVSVALGDNTWSHIAWGRSSGSHFLYVNGSSVSFSQGTQQFNSSSTSFSATSDLEIFSSAGAGGAFAQGQCDEAAIWDSALTATQITNIYNNRIAGDLSTFDPEIWWRMGDGTGDTNSSGGAPANGGTIGTILNQGSLASSNSAGVNGTLFSDSVPA